MRKHGYDISEEYARVIGHVVTRWGRFESDLDSYLALLRMNATAVQLEPTIPQAFQKRARLFKKTARYCFGTAPTLADKIDALIERARILCVHRNRLLHGWTFDSSASTQGKDGLQIFIYEKGKRNAYVAMLGEIDALGDDINRLHGDFLLMFAILRGNSLKFHDERFLTFEEIEALQRFWTTYLEGRPSPIPSRVVPPPPSFRR